MKSKSIKMEFTWKYKDLWPFNGMVNDLWRGIQAEENYLVALGLMAYSEILGRMILGTIGSKELGAGKTAFREFTEHYVNYSFTDTEWQIVFDNFRNGLVHQFFIKAFGSIVYNDDGSASCGIDVSKRPYKILIHSYFIHFTRGLEKAIDKGILK